MFVSGHAVMKGMMQSKLKMRVEPGLFEWLGWYKERPEWMTHQELISAGYSIDTSYTPVMREKELRDKKVEERRNPTAHYDRMELTCRLISQKHADGGTVLIIGHGTTMDAAFRSFLDIPIPGKTITRKFLDKIGDHFPYCSIIGIEPAEDLWKIIPNLLPNITQYDYSNRVDFHYLAKHGLQLLSSAIAD